jgi:hypothetical protein
MNEVFRALSESESKLDLNHTTSPLVGATIFEANARSRLGWDQGSTPFGTGNRSRYTVQFCEQHKWIRHCIEHRRQNIVSCNQGLERPAALMIQHRKLRTSIASRHNTNLLTGGHTTARPSFLNLPHQYHHRHHHTHDRIPRAGRVS